MLSYHRWQWLKVRRALLPPNGIALHRWIDEKARQLKGRVINVGAGADERAYGERVVRVDRFAPHPTVRADLECALPFRAGVFDCAVCTEVIEHVPDPRGLLSEISRVLKPGASVLITIPFLFRYHPDPQDFMRLTPIGLQEELTRAGFEVEFLSGIGGWASAMTLLLEAIHPIVRIMMRLLVTAVRPVLVFRTPRNLAWSDWASHAVAIARKPEERG